MNLHPSHIPFSRLVDYVVEQLMGEERAQLQQHLTSCPRCRQELSEVARLIGTMQADSAVDPPLPVITRTLRIFQPRSVPAAQPLLQRIVAALQFDSAHLSPAIGLRAGPAGPRQLLYRAGDYGLDLRLTPAEDVWVLSGQILGGDITAGHVELQGVTGSIHAPVTVPSEFVLPPIPVGDYTLVVHWSDFEIAVESFKVGS